MPHYLFIHKLGVCQGKYFDALLMEQVQESVLKKKKKKTTKPLSNIYGLLKVEILGKKAAFLFTYFPGWNLLLIYLMVYLYNYYTVFTRLSKVNRNVFSVNQFGKVTPTSTFLSARSFPTIPRMSGKTRNIRANAELTLFSVSCSSFCCLMHHVSSSSWGRFNQKKPNSLLFTDHWFWKCLSCWLEGFRVLQWGSSITHLPSSSAFSQASVAGPSRDRKRFWGTLVCFLLLWTEDRAFPGPDHCFYHQAANPLQQVRFLPLCILVRVGQSACRSGACTCLVGDRFRCRSKDAFHTTSRKFGWHKSGFFPVALKLRLFFFFFCWGCLRLQVTVTVTMLH